MKIRAGLTMMAILFGFGPAAAVADTRWWDPTHTHKKAEFTGGPGPSEAIPATLCQQAGGSQSLDYYHGRVRNWSAHDKIVDCPIVTGVIGYAEVGANLVAVDRNPERDVGCTIYTYDDNSGSVSYRWSSARTSGASNTPQTLRLGPVTRLSYGPSLIGCTLPGVNNAADMSEIVSFTPKTEF
jgi:hypothetical protein